MVIFDPDKHTEVHTDASAIGIGAILLQQVNGQMSVVAYYSRQTTADQRCYHSYELETMAVVLVLRHFRVYLRYRIQGCDQLQRITADLCKEGPVTSDWSMVARGTGIHV